MYICACNGIKESELRRIAHYVEGDAEACYAALGKRPNCRQCLEEADDIVREERIAELRVPALAG